MVKPEAPPQHFLTGNQRRVVQTPPPHLSSSSLFVASSHFSTLGPFCWGDRRRQPTLQKAEGAPEMSVSPGTLVGLGFLFLAFGLGMAFLPVGSALGIVLGVGGLGLLVTGVCMAMNKGQVMVPGHYLLHPRTGTRFNPQQALAIQR